MIINFAKSSKQDPGYLISGISSQSHWLAENSNVSGSTVTSVVDEFGLENLVQYGVGAVYEPNGWGGDNGPSILINGSNLTGNGWATRIAGSRIPFVMTAKVEIISTAYAATPWGFSSGSGNSYPIHLGPRRRNLTQTEMFRCAYSSANATYYTHRYGTPLIVDGYRHNLLVEYTGSSHRLFVDGIEMVYDYTKTLTSTYNCVFTTFMIGGWGTNSPCNLRLAEMHIYKPYHSTFSTFFKDKLIADLQNRRGT